MRRESLEVAVQAGICSFACVSHDRSGDDNELQRERRELLFHVERWLDTPILVLGFVWLGLLVLELWKGLTPALERAGIAIWAIFIVDFLLRFALAPEKTAYLRKNWLTAISLVVPALRVFRVFRVLRILRVTRAARATRLVRILGSINRSMAGLGRTFGRRGFKYVLALTFVVLLAGAGGMLAFERDVADPSGIHDFGTALWWTAMVLTTMGSAYFPKTAEGRALCLMLAVYAFTIFGYVTATLASFFLARDTEDEDRNTLPADVRLLREEVRALRAEIRDRDPGR
jgi:voltage-gated potassium channel